MDPQIADRSASGTSAPAAPARTTASGYRKLSAGMAMSDLVVVLASFLASYGIRFGFSQGYFDFLAVMVVAPPAFIGIFAAFRLYSAHRFGPAEEFRRIFYAVTVGITGVVTLSFWTKAELSRQWVGVSWALCLLLMLGTRRLWHHVVWKARQRGALTYRTLIVGGNEEAGHFARVMSAVAAGFEPIGFVAVGEGRAEMGDLPQVGALEDLDASIRELGIECVFVASSALRERDMAIVTKSSRRQGIELKVSANIPELLSTRLSAQPLGGVMVFSVWPVRLSGLQAATKRTFDLVGGSVALILSLILWVPIGLAVKLGSRGPVLFRQTRVGRRERPFTLLKFRTMIEGAAAIDVPNDSEGPLFKSKSDPRITTAGRFLRRWSLDELPQLLNVLRGRMSLVGPRPPLPEEVELYEDWQRDRLEVRPGMTGLWQVRGRSDLSFDDYVRLDLFYIENWSLAYDFYLLAKTIPAVLSGRGAA